VTAKLKKASKATRAGESIDLAGKLSKRRTKPGVRSGKKRNSAKQQEAEHHRKANEYLLEAWKLLYTG
jgi:hypothetical protein